MDSEQFKKRLANQYAILRALHFEGPLRRSRLSTLLGIRRTSVTNIVADLLQEGLICEEHPDSARSALQLDTTHVHALCASVVPDGIHFGRVYLDGRLDALSFRPIAPLTAPQQVIADLAEGLQGLRAMNSGRSLCFGVALPGIIDSDNGVCRKATNLYQWHDIRLADELAHELQEPVHVDNDVRCRLRASVWFDRLARDAENAIFLHVHEGVACAIMSRGRLILGERFSAGEIGHVRVGEEGRLCSCGRSDCLETYCSFPAIQRELAKIMPELQLHSGDDVVRAARDVPAIEHVLDRVARRLARALAGLVAALDPAALVLGTSSRAFSDLMRPLLQRHLYNELIGSLASDAEILTAGDSIEDSLRGIAARVIDRSFNHTLLQPDQRSALLTCS